MVLKENRPTAEYACGRIYRIAKTAVIDKNNMMQYIAPQDLKSFGLIPEIIGRLPVLTYLNPLDRNALRAILTEPKTLSSSNISSCLKWMVSS